MNSTREIDRYLWLAKQYRERFGNEVEEIRALEYALHLNPDEPAAIEQLRLLYQKRRATEKLRLLSEDRRRLAANARPPSIPPATFHTGSRVAACLAGIVLVAVPVLVTIANLRIRARIPLHHNAGGFVGWLAFAVPTACSTAIVFGLWWFFVKFSLRHGGIWVVVPAVLSCTALAAMIPTLAWTCIDAANIAFDRSPHESATLVVVGYTQRGKGNADIPVAEDAGRPGSTVVLNIAKVPIGTVIPAQRGKGLLRRHYVH